MRGPALTPAALRGLLDATPAAIGCFDAQLRAVYVNTAFTIPRACRRAASSRRARSRPRSGRCSSGPGRRAACGSRSRTGCRSPARCSCSRTRWSGSCSTRARTRRSPCWPRSSPRPARGNAGGERPEPEAIFHVVAEEAGRLLHARSAATIRYEGDFALTVGRWVDDDLGGFEVGTIVPTTDSDGLTAVVARTGAPARIEDYRGLRGIAAERWSAGLPVRGRRAGRGHGRTGLGPRPGRLDGRARGGRRAPARRIRGAGCPCAGIGGGPRGAQGLAHPHPRGGRDGTPAARAQPARRRAARLVAIAVQLRVLEKRLGEPDKAIALLRGAATELEQALAELRELARGLHPAVLADRGLAAALETLASRLPLPLDAGGRTRGPAGGAAGGRRVLRRRGEPHQRRQARRGRARCACDMATRRGSAAETTTMAAGRRPRGGGTGLRGSGTGSRRSAAG